MTSPFESLRKRCLEEGRLWEDPDFPAADISIYRSRYPPYRFQWLRPTEIARGYGVAPRFFHQGGTRFDLIQGELGDCWVLAAAASVSTSPHLFQRLVPPEQNFDRDWYAGVFHFHIWRYGEWVEVVVDDRLPTMNGKLKMLRSGHPGEFWGCLLEKAYAKLHGSYEALKAGRNEDALTDFTGGLVESYDLRRMPSLDFPRMLAKASERGSIMTASIWGDAVNNIIHRNGLVSGHAYSITGLAKVKDPESGGQEMLVRIRNPWGSRVEWNGAWSDKSSQWQALSSSSRKKLGLIIEQDGEFWMSLSDFVLNFDSIEICNLTADSLRDPPKSWAVSVAHSRWIRDVNAGGRPALATFWKNPQFVLKVQDHDEDDDQSASFVVEVLQKNRRRRNLRHQAIGFVVFQVPQGAKLPLEEALLSSAEPVGSVEQYVNTRSVVGRFAVRPGQYVIMPTTWSSGDEGEFMLRVFSEAAHDSKKVSIRKWKGALCLCHTFASSPIVQVSPAPFYATSLLSLVYASKFSLQNLQRAVDQLCVKSRNGAICVGIY